MIILSIETFLPEFGHDTGLCQLVQRPFVLFVHASVKPFVRESLSQRFLDDVTRHRLVFYVFSSVIVQTGRTKGTAARLALRSVIAAPARRFHPFDFVKGHFLLDSMYAHGRLSQRFQKIWGRGNHAITRGRHCVPVRHGVHAVVSLRNS
jgi:hypothetical protein